MIWSALPGDWERRTGNGCVATLCDEIDKGLAGAGGGGGGDSGVTKRVFGTIISWMQEHKADVFLVASANDVTNLPPELLRKGRFDELFAIDLPSTADRAEILGIQLRRFGRDPDKFELDAVAAATDSFTGSEIEAVIAEALYTAFGEGQRELTTDDLLAHAATIVPLARTAAEQIDAIRAWARTRARFAATPESERVRGEVASGRRQFS